MNVKLIVKVIAVLLMLVLNGKLLFSKDVLKNRLLLFYFGMIIICIIHLVIQAPAANPPYLIAAGVGILFWLFAAFACQQTFLFVDKNDPASIHATITAFLMLNALFTFGNLVQIIIETGALNPYTYQGMYQKYFMSTGDYMKGITFDTSTTNALLNAFGVVYFINRKKPMGTFVCMAVLLLTASNFSNVLLVATLGYLILFKSSKDQKSLIVICLLSIVVFLVKVSPQNDQYVKSTFEKIFRNDHNPLSVRKDTAEVRANPVSFDLEERKRRIARGYLDSIRNSNHEKYLARLNRSMKAGGSDIDLKTITFLRPGIPKADIHSKPFQRKTDTTLVQKQMMQLVKQEKAGSFVLSSEKEKLKVAGKVVSFEQTVHFLKDHPGKILLGDGVGNFSSKLAFRVTGLQIAGGYPKRFVYISNDFRDNHLALFLYYFSKDAELHSIIHTPNSVYDQLLGEYGVIGLAVFILFYLGFFIKHHKTLTYGVPLLLILSGAFCVDYWFEQLSIVIIFELLLFLNIREHPAIVNRNYERS